MALQIPTRRSCRRYLAACVAVTVAVAACGGSTESKAPGTIGEYAAAMSATVDRFDEERAAAVAEDYPFDEELIEAAGVFGAYQNSLDTVRAISPPPEVAAEQDDLVARFTAMQDEVGVYLDKAKFEAGFTFDGLNADPTVAAAVAEFFAACDRLVDRLPSLDVDDVPGACVVS